MIAISLQSGSNGNCIYVEAGGVKLVFDAGISALQAERRLASRGRDIRRADAVLISHDHSDHSRCAGVYHRKLHLPVYLSEPTLRAAQKRCGLGEFAEVRHFQSGSELTFGDVRVQTIRTPHDAADGVAFVVDDGHKRLGILTDLGHVFGGLGELLATLDAVFLESNYDPYMLAHGPYPYYLQQRISGRQGHLSNEDAAGLLCAAASPRLRWACLAHLSEHNNRPELALETHRRAVGDRVPLCVASRYEAGEILAV